MFNSIGSMGGMFNVLNQRYIGQYQLGLHQATQMPTNQNSSFDTQKLSETMRWNQTIQDLNNRSHQIYKSGFELQTINNYEFQSDELSNEISNLIASSNHESIRTWLLDGAEKGSFTIDVSQLAKGMETKSRMVSNANVALGYVGEFSVDNVTFSVAKEDSLSDIANEINQSNINVSAQVDEFNRLVMRSKTTGSEASFEMIDLTSNENTFSSSDQTIVSTNELFSNTNWSKEVDVLQLASGTVQTFSDDFSDTTTEGNWSVVGRNNGSWSMQNGSYQQTTNSTNYETDRFWGSIQNSTVGALSERTATSDVTFNNSEGYAGVLLDYTDNNNYVAARFSNIDLTAEEKPVLELVKVVDGVETIESVAIDDASLSNNNTANYSIEASTDGDGNYSAVLYNASGEQVQDLNVSGWDDALTGGSSGVYSLGAAVNFNSFEMIGDNSVEAIYEVDGVQYKSDDNNVVLQNSLGEDLASVSLENLGNTTIDNVATNAVLENLSFLNESGDKISVTQQAQDAFVSFDGGNYEALSSNTTTYNNVGISFVDETNGAVTVSIEEKKENVFSPNTNVYNANDSFGRIVDFVSHVNSMSLFLEYSSGHIDPTLKQELKQHIGRASFNLSQIGIEQDKNGILKIDNDYLKEQINNNFNDVKDAFFNETRGLAINTMNMSLNVMQDTMSFVNPLEFTQNTGNLFNQYY